MDVGMLSMGLAMRNTHQAVGTAMLKNSMDLMKQNGNAIAAMMQTAPAPALNPPGVGGTIDVSL